VLRPISDKDIARVAKSGIDIAKYKELGVDQQQSIANSLAQEEQQAMMQGFDAAKLGFDKSRS
jgi:hypothetical protein